MNDSLYTSWAQLLLDLATAGPSLACCCLDSESARWRSLYPGYLGFIYLIVEGCGDAVSIFICSLWYSHSVGVTRKRRDWLISMITMMVFMINVELETSLILKFITSVTHVTLETTHILSRQACGDHRQLVSGRSSWQGSIMRALSPGLPAST